MTSRVVSRQRTSRYLAIGFFLCTFSVVMPAAQSQQKKRIAVMSFDVGADAKANAAKQFGMVDDLGRDLSDLLLAKFSTDGKYALIERTALEKILKEQAISNSDRNDPATAAKIGKIAGVDAIVIAIVTQYGGETKESNTNVGAIPGMGALKSLGGFSKKDAEVNVEMNARLVDTSTGEILGTAKGVGKASKSKTSLKAATAVYNTKSADFGTSMVGVATNQAIDSIADQLEKVPSSAIGAATTAPVPPLPTVNGSYSGSVVDINGNTLILKVGTKAGVKVGDIINITRPGRAIKDEDGTVIKVLVDQIGSAQITEADETTATAIYSGKLPVQLKDKAVKAK